MLSVSGVVYSMQEMKCGSFSVKWIVNVIVAVAEISEISDAGF